MNEVKNKNLFIRVSEKEKNMIEHNAERCGLSVSEYLRQRALGYMPRAVLPEIFFSFNDKLALCGMRRQNLSRHGRKNYLFD